MPLRAMTTGIIDRGSSAEAVFKIAVLRGGKVAQDARRVFFSSSAGLRSIRTV